MERIIPLAGESGGPRIRVHQRFRRRGWSVYGAQRSQPVATGGKCASPENGSNKPKPLPPIATSCRSERMVRRGSTPRVRQRASVEKQSPEIGILLPLVAPQSTSTPDSGRAVGASDCMGRQVVGTFSGRSEDANADRGNTPRCGSCFVIRHVNATVGTQQLGLERCSAFRAHAGRAAISCTLELGHSTLFSLDRSRRSPKGAR
jgi:hypothetical protein